MGDATKKQALAKLDAFVAKIGYPDKWRDYSRAHDRPRQLRRQRARARTSSSCARNLDKIGKPVDRNEWGMTPQTVNAYYNPLMNEIVFPAGILQPPFFDARRRRRRQLRRHRRGHRPRDDARLRRPGPPVRRQGQPAELVDRRRPQALRGARRQAASTSTATSSPSTTCTSTASSPWARTSPTSAG